MKKDVKIADSEWLVMRVLWQRSPLSANEVVEGLAGQVNWHPRTVKTLLNRLLHKEAIAFRKEGRAYLYYPLVEEAGAVRAEGHSFLERVYGGALAPMIADMLESEKLSAGDIAELRRMLDEKER